MAIAHFRIGTFERAMAVPGPHAEIAPAGWAPVGHRLRVGHCPCLDTAALPAAALAGPQHILEPRGGRFFGGEHLHQLDQAHAFSVRFPRCVVAFLHGRSILNLTRLVK